MAIPKTLKEVQESIQDVQETIQDEIASKAKRKTTLKSLKLKKKFRLVKLRRDYEEEVRAIHIQYSQNPERLKAKYAAAEYAKSEKAMKRAERRIENEKRLIELAKKITPPYCWRRNCKFYCSGNWCCTVYCRNCNSGHSRNAQCNFIL